MRISSGKSLRLVPFAEVSFDELRAATRAAASRAGKVQKSAPPLVKALKAILSKAKLGSVGVRLRGGRVDLSGIPATELNGLGKVLAGATLPVQGRERTAKP